mmetsp:Transcript_15541/g.35313  ORF Transcript_15541/g.35313 Transcript_15541/m.35313 type:complete len:95 (-) Transcript_15541:27-311(-)
MQCNGLQATKATATMALDLAGAVDICAKLPEQGWGNVAVGASAAVIISAAIFVAYCLMVKGRCRRVERALPASARRPKVKEDRDDDEEEGIELS